MTQARKNYAKKKQSNPKEAERVYKPRVKRSWVWTNFQVDSESVKCHSNNEKWVL